MKLLFLLLPSDVLLYKRMEFLSFSTEKDFQGASRRYLLFVFSSRDRSRNNDSHHSSQRTVFLAVDFIHLQIDESSYQTDSVVFNSTLKRIGALVLTSQSDDGNEGRKFYSEPYHNQPLECLSQQQKLLWQNFEDY